MKGSDYEPITNSYSVRLSQRRATVLTRAIMGRVHRDSNDSHADCCGEPIAGKLPNGDEEHRPGFGNPDVG